jgi:anti-sigma regulatory factor (Ser/Thr protein kinase)
LARQFTGAALADLIRRTDEVIDDTELVVSELVTNAVAAGSSGITLTLELHHSHVRIAVEDDAPGTPVAQVAADTDDHGRGLMIVSRLAAGWGISPVSGGKAVWADLPVPTPFTARDFDCPYPLP